jgi:hypothetical protein
VPRGKPKKALLPPAPDELIKTGKEGRIRLIETRKPRRPIRKRKSR